MIVLVGFEILTLMAMRIIVFYDVIPCILLDIYQYIRGTWYCHLQALFFPVLCQVTGRFLLIHPLLAQTWNINDTAVIDAGIAWNLPGSSVIIYTAYLQWNMSKVTPDFHTPAFTFYCTYTVQTYVLQHERAILIVCTI